jgi:hypothetical protein
MKEALDECLKSLESMAKAVCSKRKWSYDPKATMNALIQILFDNGLVPAFWAQHFSSLRSTLESGVPTARNRLGAHGQGTEIVEVPPTLPRTSCIRLLPPSSSSRKRKGRWASGHATGIERRPGAPLPPHQGEGRPTERHEMAHDEDSDCCVWKTLTKSHACRLVCSDDPPDDSFSSKVTAPTAHRRGPAG